MDERLVGSQTPRIHVVPPAPTSSGNEVCALADRAGLVLDPWQRLILRGSLGEREDGRWAAFESAVIVGRQNGKSAVFEARMLAGLFLFGERLLIYSSHEFKTSLEIFRRMDELIAGTSAFSRRVKSISRTRGEEGFELHGGQRLRFLARSNNSGRGFSGDWIGLDECQNLPDGPVDAMMPSVSARPNPQIWYGGSAPDFTLAPCEQITRVRNRALSGDARGLAYFEWSADLHAEDCARDCAEHDDADDPLTWAKTNPGLGIRLEVERIERERDSMSDSGFKRERLSVGRYPRLDGGDSWDVISQEAWEATADPELRDPLGELVHPGSQPLDPVAFAVEVSPDRSMAAIAVAGYREDGLAHVEVTDHRPGTDWVVPRLVELRERWSPCAIALNPAGPAGSLITRCEEAEIELVKPSVTEVKGACGDFYDAVVPPPDKPEGWASSLRHIPHPGLTAALGAAVKRVTKDTWQWDLAAGDASPLSAVTLARWAHGKYGPEWVSDYDVTASVF
jgi:hypothetical protein